VEYLDRHIVSCGDSAALQKLRLTRPTSTTLAYSYKCISGFSGGATVKMTDVTSLPWGRNVHYLDRQDLKCDGKGISYLQLITSDLLTQVGAYTYNCLNQAAAGSCRDVTTSCQTTNGHQLHYLDRHNVECGSNEMITRLHLRSCDSDSVQYEYTCCNAYPPPPPPSPPPPSPPPPSPPPPGESKEAVVSMDNPVEVVSAYSFDFGVKVAHVACDNDADCFESTVEGDASHESGLRCQARVTLQGEECTEYGEYLPCREWDDFSPKSLEMTNNQGEIVDGTYDVTFSCYFVHADGTTRVTPDGDWETLHTFELRAGCADVMPHGNDRNLEHVARLLLLTSDEFNVADCRDESHVYKAKETVFRRYDNDPEDGVLTYAEILAALEAQSADSYILDLWNEELNGELELKPAHVMRVEVNDMECGSGSIVYDDAVYPSDSPGRESTLQQCIDSAQSMRVAWHYNAELTGGDYVCLYVDGMLYDKLSVSMTDPDVDGYSDVGDGLYAATEFTDIRPVSGTFEDVQESLVANFLFDGDDAGALTSSSPRVSGQQGANPKLLPVGTKRDIQTCSEGDGGLCLSAVSVSSVGLNQYGYAYTSDELFADDMAMSSWIYRQCGSAVGSDTRRTSIAYFTGENGGISHELRFYLTSSMDLKLEYARDDSVSSSDSLKISGLECDSWHYVGFSLNKRDKMVLFSNPTGAVDDTSDTSTFKTAGDMDPDTPRKLLSFMTSFEMLGAVDVEFDDVRVYRGQVSRATFLDAYRCGHRPLCAKRAHATPASRRVVCASAVIAKKSENTYSDYFCTAAMYYDGAAIDVSAMLDTSGVTFSYRDTSWEESSFEMLRKPVGEEFSSASYETIIQMDGDLKGCVNKFSSISYLDREAGNKPYLEWYYKVRTKMADASSSDLVSTTHYFKAPWIGTLEGTVTAGASGTPVAHVRVCADFAWPNGTAMSSSTLHETSGDLALYMRATHSSNMTRTASEKTYVVTDGDPDPRSGASSLNPGEYVRVELARWSSIERVEVCMSGQVSSSQRLRAYVQEYDSGDSGNHGHECTFNAELTTSHAQHTCMFYDCVGSELRSFHGKFINVVRDEVSSSEGVPSQIPMSGLYSWFKSSEASKTWKSEVNGFVGKVKGGNVKTEFHTGNGATGVIRTLAGDQNAKFNFGDILPAEWTLCTLSRYTGNNRKRIIMGKGNFAHGHYGDKRGVAYYDQWLLQNSRGTKKDWLIMCGTNNGESAYVDGQQLTTLANRNGQSAYKQVGINYAPSGSSGIYQRSNWAVAEVITWNRALTDDEMEQVSDYLKGVKSSVSVSEIHATGTNSNCRFSAVSDDDGAYEIKLTDLSGDVPVKAKVLSAAYKEDIFAKTDMNVIDPADASASQPTKVLLVLRQNDNGSSSSSSSSLGSSTSSFEHWDGDESGNLSFDEFATFVEDAAYFPMKGHAIVPSSLWSALDADGDGSLGSSEFNAAKAKMQSGDLIADPIIAYGSIDAKYLSAFVTSRGQANACENFVLARTNSTAMPANTSAWNAFYEELFKSVGSSLSSLIVPCANVDAVYAGGDSGMTKMIPLRVLGVGSKIVSLSSSDSNLRLEDDLDQFDVYSDFEASGQDGVVLGSCTSAESVSVHSITSFGKWLGILATISLIADPSAPDGTATYVALFQRYEPDARCKMLKFTIQKQSDGNCIAQTQAARIKFGVCDTDRDEILSEMDDGYELRPLAYSNEHQGWGLRSVRILASGPVLSATEQFDDIVHEFDSTQMPNSKNASIVFEQSEISDVSDIEANLVDMRHRGEMQRNFHDETVAIVRGAVLFPKDWTEGSTTCGLFEAVIEVSELNQDGKPEEFTTDESGWFEMALTRGKSFVINATFPKHTICYTGRTIADAVDVIDCDGMSQTVTLNQVGDGNYIFFTDVTQGNIDLGVYHGQCESQYSDAQFKVTPINGCHPTVLVTSEQIGGWMTNVEGLPEGKFDDELNPLPDNARVWPFAAMDYSITLDSGPSVSGISDLIADETWKDGCATEDGDMMTFFRRRNALERLALMRDENDWQEIRYKYHGYICVDIPDAYIPKIDDDDDKCYDPAEPAGGLTSKHFLGTSSSDENPVAALLSIEKNVRVKIFELHVMSDGTYKKCFEKLPNRDDETGSTEVKVRQDVSNAVDSECHPDRGGGASCDFQVTVDDDGYLEFPGTGSQMTISAGFPNLAGNHRRTVRVEVERNDLYRSVTATAIRELIPLGSKPRGGDGLSDDTFWATVPLDGLVYTVVHDPPGGNSYAELLSGTEFRVAYEITGMRAMTITGGTYLSSEFGLEAEGTVGLNLGYTAEGTTDVVKYKVKGGAKGEAVVSGPNFKVQSVAKNNWDIVMTTDRAVRSSQDPALPGRAGDTILGGGIELVYKISDILDLSDPSGDSVCLDVQAQITWLPRKPTSYVLAVHAIETQILPNLRFLLKTVMSPGGVSDIDQSGKPDSVSWEDYLNRKIASWERTLAWSSPEDVSNITAPFTSDESVYGKSLQDELGRANGYNALFDADADYSSVATALATEWSDASGFDVAQAAPMLLLALVVAPLAVPTLTTQALSLGVSAFVQEARLLPYIRSDSDANPIEGADSLGNIPYSTSSIVHPKARSGVGKQSFDSTLRDTEGEVFYTFGMSERAASDMESWSTDEMSFEGTSISVSEDDASPLAATDTSRVIASLTGGVGPLGMANGDDAYPPDAEILLSFSGGGHALEFSFTSDEKIKGYNSHVAFEIDGAMTFGGGYTADVTASTPVIGAYTKNSGGIKYGWNRDFRHDRVFVWSKRGHVETKYSLGDPQFGDKFVISVSSDKRFGTPLFSTKGGRSMCPGELGTVFRESSVYTEIPLKTKMNTENLNPGQRAMFELVIKNESPYREAGLFALRLVDGLQSSINEIVAAAYAKAGESSSVTASDVVQEVTNVAQSTIAKDAEDVSRMQTAASDAANGGGTAESVADAVYSASTTAPGEATEFGDSTFLVNGNRFSVGDYMPLKFIGGDALSRQKAVSQMYLNFAIEPGFATRRIEYLQLRLQSLCETQMWEDSNMYRDPISYTQNVDPMSWSQPCPKVQFDESTMSNYLYSSQSPSSSGVLNLKVNNPDQYVLWPDDDVSDSLMNERLSLVRLQYRPVSGGEWITAKDESSAETDKKFNLLCADSRTEGCKFDWDVNNDYEKLLSGFKDDVYELRVKNFCFGGPSLADPSVHEFVGDQRLTLTVDTKLPMVKHVETSFGRYVMVEYDESINCDAQSVSIVQERTGCGESGGSESGATETSWQLKNKYQFKCTGGVWVARFPSSKSGRYSVAVDGITDSAGNAADAFETVVDIHCATAAARSALGAKRGSSARAPSSAKSGDFATGWRDVRASVSMGAVASFVMVVGAAVVVLRRRRDGHADAQMESNKPLYDKEQHGASGGYGAAL
jgi:hypothetical protein